MPDFVLVPSPGLFPNCCAFCHSQKGPILDSRGELGPTGMRLYVCKLCAQLIAQEFGFAEGPELEKLVNARAELEQKDVELDRAHREVQQLTTQVRAQIADMQRIAEERDAAVEEAQTLRHLAADAGEAARALAAGGREA
jgi:septal ring factor EnvC (AmiA/AmiB activator)